MGGLGHRAIVGILCVVILLRFAWMILTCHEQMMGEGEHSVFALDERMPHH